MRLPLESWSTGVLHPIQATAADSRLQTINLKMLWWRTSRLTRCAPRQALRYLVRNTTLPQTLRARAQLQLSRMHCYTRGTQIRNRCTMGGVAKGVFRDFRMGRVSVVQINAQQCYSILHPDMLEKDNRSRRLTFFPAVPIPDECAGWKHTRGEESKLVMCCKYTMGNDSKGRRSTSDESQQRWITHPTSDVWPNQTR